MKFTLREKQILLATLDYARGQLSDLNNTLTVGEDQYARRKIQIFADEVDRIKEEELKSIRQKIFDLPRKD